MTLNDIGLKCGTDKATTHFYLDNYERYFSQFRDNFFTLLEIGVGAGGSIKMWREYFPNASVYGIDNNPDLSGENIFIGDQKDYNFLTEVRNKIGPLTIVIDDGSHVGSDMITTFKFFFKDIIPGGYYVLEDTHCLYEPHYAGEFEGNNRSKAYNYFTDLTYHVDVAGRGLTGNFQYAIDHGMLEPPVPEFSRELAAIHIHPSLYFFEHR